MSRQIALLSDPHWMLRSPVGRTDDILVALKRKWTALLDWCAAKQAPLLIAGDFTHGPRSWYLLPELLRFLSEWDVRIYVIFGQHDTYMYSEATRSATVLGALIAAGVVEPLGVWGTELYEDVKVFGCNYGETVDELEEVRVTSAEINILVVHQMIVPNKVWSTQEEYIYAPEFLNKNPQFDLILCGDCHRKFKFNSVDRKKRIICNTGPLARYEADAYNFKHEPGFFVYDTDERKAVWHTLPHGKAENVLSRSHLDKEEIRSAQLDEFIHAVRSGKVRKGAKFIDNLRALIAKENARDVREVKQILAETIDEEL